MAIPQVVIDTNVLVAAFRSKRGASDRLLSLLDAGKFQINLSVPLVLGTSSPEFSHGKRSKSPFAG